MHFVPRSRRFSTGHLARLASTCTCWTLSRGPPFNHAVAATVMISQHECNEKFSDHLGILFDGSGPTKTEIDSRKFRHDLHARGLGASALETAKVVMTGSCMARTTA